MAAPVRIAVSYGDIGNVFSAKHPRSGQVAQFARSGSHVMEIHRYTNPTPSSWAWPDQVVQNGGLFVCNPVDPLFMLLPRLEEARGTVGNESKGLYKAISDIVCDSDSEVFEQFLLTLPGIDKQLAGICDVNDKYDELTLRLNDAKLMAWLKRKTLAVQGHLLASRESAAAALDAAVGEQRLSQFDSDYVGTAAVQTHDRSADVKAATLAEAISLVAEYLGETHRAALASTLGVGDAAVAAQRAKPKQAIDQNLPAAINYSTMMDEEENASAKKQKVTTHVKPKVVPPLKKGQKTMASFFKPK